MHTPFALLKLLAKALGNAVGGGIAGDFLVEILPGLAEDVWGWWSKDRTAEQCRAEVQALAQAGIEDVRRQVADIVRELLPDRPAQVQQAVKTYLTEVPASIRRSLRRPSDPTGTTVPADVAPRKADDLLRLLPARLSRFQPGGHPLVGVDWELEELLGVGGFGEVWKARNPHLSSAEPVALKFCLDPSAAKVLRNEAAVLDRVMRQGRHPGIVQLLRTYLSAETPCLEYEYVAGGDLTGLIQEWHRVRGGPTPAQAAKVMLRVAEVMAFAHGLNPPIVHRDLKPANILVQRTTTGETHFKVADFGIGGVAVGQAIRESSRGTSRGRFLTSALHGSYTPLYASPQQMHGEAPDLRDDVYSLGVIWYQLLTGNLSTGRPGGMRWQQRLGDRGVPGEQIELLASCFEEEPGDRLADAAALAEALLATMAAAPRQPKAGDTAAYPPEEVLQTAQEYVTRAEVHRARDEFDRAIADATEALRLDPSLALGYGIRAEAYRRKNGFDRAIADATEAIRLDPRYSRAYFTRADAYRCTGELDLAIDDATEAIRLFPKYSRAYLTRAEAYRGREEYDRAIADVTEAIRLKPDYGRAYLIRAETYRHQEQYDRAIADATEAIRLDPRYSRAYLTRAEAYRGKGEYDRAIADAGEAIRLDPKYVWAYGTRGCAFRLKGDFASAIADLSEALRLDPNYAWGREQLEMAKRRQK